MEVTFKTNTDDGMVEMNRLAKSLDMALAINEVLNYACGLTKYEERESIPCEEVADKLYEIFNEKNIDIDDILE